MSDSTHADLDDLDRSLVLATQGGLPLHVRPYDELARQMGVEAALVKQRMLCMVADGRIRRIAAVMVRGENDQELPNPQCHIGDFPFIQLRSVILPERPARFNR